MSAHPTAANPPAAADDLATPAPAADAAPAAAADAAAAPNPARELLRQLAQSYPALFGESPRPLKRGIFHDIAAAHPELPRDTLRTALDLHTRSIRYLQALTSGQPRCDLQGQATEAVAPEHVLHALLWLHRRRQPREGETPQSLLDKLRGRIAHAYLRSGLSTSAYLDCAQVRDPALLAVVQESIAHASRDDARAEALLHAWSTHPSRNLQDFAAAYGLDSAHAHRLLHRAHTLQKTANPSATLPPLPRPPASARRHHTRPGPRRPAPQTQASKAAEKAAEKISPQSAENPPSNPPFNPSSTPS